MEQTASARVVTMIRVPRVPVPPAAMASPAAAEDVRIDGWLVQPALNMLTRDAIRVPLRNQLMDLLMCLASCPGKVFGKEELVAIVWEGRWVASSAVSRCIAELRGALGDDAQNPRIIETITKRGYRLIAAVEPVEASGEARCAPPPQSAAWGQGPALRDDVLGMPSSLRRLVERAARVLGSRPPAGS